MLGPSLFLYYINDLPTNVESKIHLFAYLTVANTKDTESLQKDPDSMTAWSKRWAMEFHPQKCQVLTISRKKNYKMGAHILERVSLTKHLGLTITEDLR